MYHTIVQKFGIGYRKNCILCNDTLLLKNSDYGYEKIRLYVGHTIRQFFGSCVRMNQVSSVICVENFVKSLVNKALVGGVVG